MSLEDDTFASEIKAAYHFFKPKEIIHSLNNTF